MTDEQSVFEQDDIEKALKLDRTDEQVRDREGVRIVFGKKTGAEGEDWREYEIVPAVRKDARRFRANIRKFQTTVDKLISMVEAAIAEREVKNVQLRQLVNMLMVVAGGELDDAIDLVYLYCPNLQADKDWIEDHGLDEQFQVALLTVLKVAFGPFVRLFVDSSKTLNLNLSGGSDDIAKALVPETNGTEPQEVGSVISKSGADSPTK